MSYVTYWYFDILNRLSGIASVTDGQTDGRTDRRTELWLQ